MDLVSNVSDYLHSRYSGRVPAASGLLIGGREPQMLAAMLNEENNSQLLTPEEFTRVYEQNVDLRLIHWSRERMERIEPRITPDESYGFHGVLAYLHGSLTLLDGYHRTKWLLENGLTQGRYLLIE